jgi:DNA-binding transcriptional MerR regulator
MLITGSRKEDLIFSKSWFVMTTKKSNDDIILSIGELAKVSGVRQSTLKYYTEIGILPFSQDGERLIRRYKKDETLNRLDEIRELKDKNMTIKEIVEYFEK